MELEDVADLPPQLGTGSTNQSSFGRPNLEFGQCPVNYRASLVRAAERIRPR